MPKTVPFFILLCIILSCNPDTVFSSYTPLPGTWEKDEKIRFDFQIKDTVSRYHIFLAVRNDENYKFSNLFLITTMNLPNGTVITDTLEYAMARPDGSWLGEGFTSVKESKLWYKENMAFPAPGAYHLAVEHAMREQGSITGITRLAGITDIGIKIEKSDE